MHAGRVTGRGHVQRRRVLLVPEEAQRPGATKPPPLIYRHHLLSPIETPTGARCGVRETADEQRRRGGWTEPAAAPGLEQPPDHRLGLDAVGQPERDGGRGRRGQVQRSVALQGGME